MEILPSRFATTVRLAVCLPLALMGWTFVFYQLDANGPEFLSRLVMFAVFALLTSLAAWTYGKRSFRAFRRRPDFILSRSGLSLNGRLLRWKDLGRLEYSCQNRRGYRNHTCQITKSDGAILRLDLDTVSLGPRRVMLLIDFYASGARLP